MLPPVWLFAAVVLVPLAASLQPVSLPLFVVVPSSVGRQFLEVVCLFARVVGGFVGIPL